MRSRSHPYLNTVDPNLVREWKANYDAVNRITLAEAQHRTSEQRFKNLLSFIEGLSSANLIRPKHDDLEGHQRWQTLRERWIARNL